MNSGNSTSTNATAESQTPESPSISNHQSIDSKMTEASLIEQLIPSPYVDRRRLLVKLKARFGVDSQGNNNFKVQVRERF
jgi:hypothetical protein